MPKPRRLLAFALPTLVALLAVAPSAHAATPAAGAVRVAIDSAASFGDYAQSAQRNGYVILQPWQQDRMRELKRHDPSIKALVYKDLSFVAGDVGPGGLSATGVSHSVAQAHPDWYLTNRQGERITSNGYGWLSAMDVGNRAYQDAWAASVVSEMRAAGWDGVFMDDTNTTMRHHYAVDQVAKYPSDAAYQGAIESMLANVGPKIIGAGGLAIPNIGGWAAFPEVGDRWLDHVSGGMEEMFTKWWSKPREGYQGEIEWESHLRSLKRAQSRGKIFLGVSHSDNDDANAARYGWATMLLGAEGKAAFALHGDYTNETWFPEYEYDLGAPSEPESEDASGVHRRRFERGLVVVNPTSSPKQVDFGGTYSGSGLTDATSTTLASNSGLILTGAGAGAPGERVDTVPRGCTAGSARVRRLMSRSRRAGHRPAGPKRVRVVTTRGRTQLRWRRSRDHRRVRYYVVFRNGKAVATTRRTQYRGCAVVASPRVKYRIAAVSRSGRLSRRSPVVRFRKRQPAMRAATGRLSGES